MFLAKFKYENCQTINYLYVDKNNHLIGFSLDKDGIKLVDRDLINKIINVIKVNDRCVEILDEGVEGYKVFYDSLNKFKHYVKDGKEDFYMFFKNNGSDAISYKGFFEEEDLIRMIKKFVGIEVAFVIGLVGLTYLLSDNNNIVDYIHYKYNNSVYNIFYDQTYDNLVNVNDL